MCARAGITLWSEDDLVDVFGRLYVRLRPHASRHRLAEVLA